MRILTLLVLLFIFIAESASSQNVFRSVQNGNWDDASTWFSGAGSGGVEGLNYPSASDSVYIDHDVNIVSTNSGSNFVFTGYLYVTSGKKLQCEVGSSTTGLVLEGNGVLHLFGTLYVAANGDLPTTVTPAAKEFFAQGNSSFIAFTNSFLFVADDWEIGGNANVYIEDNVCLRVDDDVNFEGTGWFMCGDGDISIGGEGVASTVSFNSGSSSSQICTGTSILRNTVSADCSTGTLITTGTGPLGAAPRAVDDQITTDINTAVNIDVLNRGTADSDPALDTLKILQVGSNGAINNNTSVNGGTLSINTNGTPLDFSDDFVVYTPASGFQGTDTFQYIIEDEENLFDTATVTVNVVNCGNGYVELIGVGANGATTAMLNFTDTASIDSIVLDLIYKNGKPSFATFVTSAGETKSGVQSDAINIAGNDDGVYRTTVSSASSVTVTHDKSGGVRSFLAYIYRSGTTSSITSVHDRRVVYLFQNSYSFTQDIPAGSGPRNIKIQMPISELNTDSRSALLEVTAGPVSGSLETFSEDLGNSLKIFTLILKDVPGDVTELDVTVTSKTGGAGDSFVTAGIDFGIQCSGTAPEAIPDFESTTENTPVTIDILSNDIVGNGGFDTSKISNLGLLDPQNGTVTFNANGQAIYTPDAGFTGVDYFQYQVCDTLQLCDITTVTVSVTCAGGQFVEIGNTVGLDLGGNKDGGLSWADLNADGLIDVIVNTNDGTNDSRMYFAQKTSGVISFTDVTATNASGLLDNIVDRSVVIGDLNNDGYPDFARNEFNGSGIEVYFNKGPGATPAYSFGNATQDPNFTKTSFSTSGSVFNTEGMSIGDWNQDGWLDLIVENDGGGIEILENDRDGTFSEVSHANSGFSTGSGGSGNGDYSTIIDYNNDGFVDYMARRTSEDDLYRFDEETSKFVAVGTPNLQTNNSEKGAITFCDVDQDGDFDIIWAHQSNDNNTSIYTQNEDGTFSFGVNLVNDDGVEECDCADVDNDGDNDIFLGDDNGTSYLFKNNTPKGGSLSFAQDNDCIDPDNDVEGSEFVDYDNDGDMDLYMNVNGGNELWQNGQDDNNYLLVEPRYSLGSGRWRSAIGANVMLIANCSDTCMIMDVSGGRGHGSQKPSILHFGLSNGPDINYKVIVFYVNENGTRETVTKTVTPSALAGQKLIVYQTDSDFDLCEDADLDGIPNNIDIDDDNDGILDIDEGCPSYTASIISQSGVVDGGNVTGVPDGAFADWHVNGNIMVVDFGTTYPAGTEYTITWRERSGQSGTAAPILEESTAPASSFRTNTNTPSTNSTTAITSVITSQREFRYIRISKNNPPSSTDFEIDAIGVNPCTDSDGDGIANTIDLDSDNDGLPDILEAGGVDLDSDGRVDGVFADGDNDGWSNVFDPDNGGTVLADPNTDNDGLKNRLDIDSDNDGIVDLVEAGGVDNDKDGRILGTDSDGDGLVDLIDSDNGGSALPDLDSDNDGAKNRLDLDSDNDGIGDLTEAGGEDSDGNGIVDGVFSDTDEDGWSNVFDSDNGGSALTDPDTDNDGLNNRIDIDADDDGIVDVIEGQPSGVIITPSGIDSDGDGIDNNFDTDNGSSLITPENTDGTDNPDYTDTDSDNDGDLDILEAWDTDNDGVANVTPSNFDNDNDGLDDGLNDAVVGPNASTNVTNGGQTSASFPNLDKAATPERDWREGVDNDGDGINDSVDLDDDNDGILDTDECPATFPLVVTSSSGVADPSNITGAVNGTFADWYTNGNTGTFDFGQIYPAGTKYVITWRKRAGQSGTPIPSIEESSDNSSYTSRVNTISTIDESGVTVILTAENAFRYLRVSKTGALSSVDFEIDAIGVFSSCDTDGDGIEDYFDLDSDNDGIADIVEAGGEDTDGNGKVDDINTNGTLTADSDMDGLADRYDADNGGNAIANVDSDNDGIADTKDLDSDNDGIPDVVEAGGTDTNGDGLADNYTDSDGDGFNDVVDGDVGNDGTSENSADALVLTGDDVNNDGAPDSYPGNDNDGDGVLNQLDLDADNDGIPDVVEQGGTDVNGDGRADAYVDVDMDGFNDVVDGDVGNDGTAENSADALLLTGADNDGDGNPNSFPNGDFDGDNIYNYLDLDADDDGILDVIEAGGTDTNRDGQEDSYTDADGDGFNDNVDGDPNNSLAAGDDSNDTNTGNATTLTGADTDGDGAPNSVPNDNFDSDNNYNFLDIDADNDGITDNTEGQSTSGYIAPANADTDGDGIDDAYDSDDANFGGINSSFVLSDIDAATDANSPDYLDLDTDDDGVSDQVEGHDSNRDGVADSGSPSNTGLSGGTTDVDNDGLYDGWDNNTASTDPTNTNLSGTSHPNLTNGATVERDWREIADNDNDGIIDAIDVDDDNDGILDTEENAHCQLAPEQNISYAFYDLLPSGATVDNIPYSGVTQVGTATDFDVDALHNSITPGDDNTFSIRYTGYITIATSETYTFFTSSDDGSKLFINGTEVVDNDGNHGDQERSGTIALTPGVYAIEVLFYEDGGSEILTVSYSSGSIAKTQIPFTVLSATNYCDADNDGIPNQFDLDSDNDGITDIIEAGGVDANNDGIVDGVFADTDGDGWSNTFDPTNGGTVLTDPDTDGDGLPNRIDIDADNDGIADIIEAGGVDANNDGRVDVTTDTDADGLANTFDLDNGGTALPVADLDGDGIENYLDLDSDSDGIIDNIEGQTTVGFRAPTGTDTDMDGWDNRYDSDNGGTAITLSNNEGAGAVDYLDDDSDGDGLLDWTEGFDDDEDGDALNDFIARATAFEAAAGDPLYYVNADDSDNDGIPNWLEDSDNDGKPNFLDPDNALYKDTDQDGLVDLLDADNSGVASILPDGDTDGEYDFRDTDNQVSLPIVLIDFAARKVGAKVQLDWTTLSEINNDYFTIERSTDGKVFEPIITQSGVGNSYVKNDYIAFDTRPNAGYNYYRLSQTDFDGKKEVFNTEVVYFDKEETSTLFVYPNPTPGISTFLRIKQPVIGLHRIEMFTQSGKSIKVLEMNVSSETQELKIELLEGIKLASGIYNLRVTTKEKTELIPFVVR